MPLLPFIKTPLPKPGRTKPEIEARLRHHLTKLRSSKTRSGEIGDPDASETDDQHVDQSVPKQLSWLDERRISVRAKALSDRAVSGSTINRLKTEDRQRIETLAGGVKVIAPPSEHEADEIAAGLHAEFPWMGNVTEIVWQGLRRAAHGGEAGLRLLPTFLDGPPGIGKSAWARHLAGLLGTTFMVFEASNENASFGLVGSQKGWASATPGRLLNHMIDNKSGSSVVIIDEIEKAGNVSSNKGQQFALSSALLPLFEPMSAQRWTCPYFELQFDMSYIVWVLTANEARLLPEPFLSRCPPITVRRPDPAELQDFVRRQGVRQGLSESSLDAICTVLRQQRQDDRRVDLRLILRMLQRAEALERRPISH
jgi:hypothetical protein